MTRPSKQISPPDPALAARIRKRQIRWWLLASLFTILCTIAPLLLRGKLGSVIWICGMLACGATLGGLNHTRAWRFGLVLSIAFFLESILVGGVQTIFDLLDKARFGVTLSIPAFIGAYGGAFVRKLVYGRIHLTGEPESIRFWKAAVGFGVGAGVLALVTGTSTTVPIPSMIVIVSAATAIAYLKPLRLWRWALALTPGLPLAVTLQIIVEISRDPASHDLYPLEIGISILYAIVPAVAGAILGRVIKTGSVLRPDTDAAIYG